MKRNIVPLLLIVTLWVVGTALTCKNIVKPLDDSKLTSQWEAAPIDTIVPRVKVDGTVYFKGNPQTGAEVTLTYWGGFVWDKETDADGKYEFLVSYSGQYTIRACYQGRCNRGPDCEDGKYEFYLGSYSDSIHIDLCISPGGPCPYYVCEK